MTFQECELAILRNAVDKSEKIKVEKLTQSEEIIAIMKQVESFIRKKKLVCYGGTAINNILPKYDQFYDRNVDIPDYDFFSINALADAKELADIFYMKGYNEVEAKAGVHKGTYKVYVNFIPVADITFLHPTLFASISKEAITIEGIKYSPPDYLRMAMYLELSRPQGDVSRWEKVLKRINLLNKHYPLEYDERQCDNSDFMRKMEHNQKSAEEIHNLVKDVFINEGCVFFGGYAASLYSSYMGEKSKHKVSKIPDFDVLSEDPERVALLVKEQLETHGFNGLKVYRHNPLGEVIPEHYELVLGEDTLGFIYRPISCHSYNVVSVEDKRINVATIDTLLSFYLAFIYADKHYFNKKRILCMSAFLFEVQQHNRLRQSGLLKRFSLNCFGKQETLDEIRSKKAKMFAKLKKGSAEYEEWFLKYNPANNPKLKAKRNKTEKTDTREDTPKEYTYEVIWEKKPETAAIITKSSRKNKTAKKKKPKIKILNDNKNLPKQSNKKGENIFFDDESHTNIDTYVKPNVFVKTRKHKPKPKPKPKQPKKREGFLY